VKLRLHHIPITAGLLAVMGFVYALPVAAQRVSLADRVALLEQRATEASEASAAVSQANIETLNQITRLSAELRELRGQIETLKQQGEQLQSALRSQLVDLDDRMQALERAAEPEVVAETAQIIDEDAQGAAAPTQRTAGAAPAAELTPAQVATTGEAAEDASADAADPAPDPAQERAAYDSAFDTLKSRRYAEAVRMFRDFLQTFPDGAYAANARYWLGESYYVVEDYANAQAQFEALIARWPAHDKAPGALLKIGLSQHGRKQYDEAEVTLQDVRQRYPGTDAASIAAERLRAIELSRLN